MTTGVNYFDSSISIRQGLDSPLFHLIGEKPLIGVNETTAVLDTASGLRPLLRPKWLNVNESLWIDHSRYMLIPGLNWQWRTFRVFDHYRLLFMDTHNKKNQCKVYKSLFTSVEHFWAPDKILMHCCLMSLCCTEWQSPLCYVLLVKKDPHSCVV